MTVINLSDWRRCPTCDGSGWIETPDDDLERCPTCKGAGVVRKYNGG